MRGIRIPSWFEGFATLEALISITALGSWVLIPTCALAKTVRNAKASNTDIFFMLPDLI
jgi:hypothetical protein